MGLLRFPDFYTRMHAAGKGDTLSTLLILAGCALYALQNGHFYFGSWLTTGKLFLVIIFIFIGSPTATHAIMDAGYESKVPFWTKDKTK